MSNPWLPCGAPEAKLCGGVDCGARKHLLWLREQIGGDLLGAATVTSDPRPNRRKDGVAVTPVAKLGA
ncbi:MAG TPA: hypothetical protein QF730_07985 [Planctomycetota bacterium]|nr:hypothetical protein [Planctomycetota bacterium]